MVKNLKRLRIFGAATLVVALTLAFVPLAKNRGRSQLLRRADSHLIVAPDDGYNFGGQTVSVTPRSVYYWFYRSQGVSIEVSPERHWWCLWICTTTTDVDAIQC